MVSQEGRGWTRRISCQEKPQEHRRFADRTLELLLIERLDRLLDPICLRNPVRHSGDFQIFDVGEVVFREALPIDVLDWVAIEIFLASDQDEAILFLGALKKLNGRAIER